MKPQHCPLVGAGASMTKNGFISACLARQTKKNKIDPCSNCEKGQAINMGKWAGPPKGIKIYTPTDWTPGPIIFPAEQSTNFATWSGWRRKRKPKHPFSTMKVGAICEGSVLNKARMRSAASQIAFRHRKKFINWIKDDTIFFERVE